MTGRDRSTFAVGTGRAIGSQPGRAFGSLMIVMKTESGRMLYMLMQMQRRINPQRTTAPGQSQPSKSPPPLSRRPRTLGSLPSSRRRGPPYEAETVAPLS